MATTRQRQRADPEDRNRELGNDIAAIQAAEERKRLIEERENDYKTEWNSCIAVWALIILVLGTCLELKQVVAWSSGSDKSQTERLMQESVPSQAFDLGCMWLTVSWMLWVCMRYCCRPPQDIIIEESHRMGKYLLLGLGVFAAGGWIAAVFQLLAFIGYSCSAVLGKLYTVTKLVFIPTQTVFLVLNRERSMFRKQFFHGLMIYHTIATNIILYVRTFIEGQLHSTLNETSLLYPDNCSPAFAGANNSSCSCPVSIDLVEAYQKSSVYLYPFSLEFSLTASALLAELWMALGREQAQQQEDKQSVRGADICCSRSIAVVASLLVSFVLVIMLMSYLDDSSYPVYIYLAFRISLASMMTIFCIVGLCGLRCTKSRGEGTGLIEVLLYISVFGILSDQMFDIIANIEGLYSFDPTLEAESVRIQAVVGMFEQSIWTVQALLQVYFISKALHRVPRHTTCCCKFANTTHVAVILGCANLGMYILDTIDVESHSVYKTKTVDKYFQLDTIAFGEIVWKWMRVTIFPLVIFFRSHSVSAFLRIGTLHSPTVNAKSAD